MTNAPDRRLVFQLARQTSNRRGHALLEHALKAERPPQQRDAQLATVLQSYWVSYARHLPSARVQRTAQASALNIWGDVNVSDFDRKKQLEIVEKLRADGLSDWTISGRLARIWAAMNWWRRDNSQLVVPTIITAVDWRPVLPDRERTSRCTKPNEARDGKIRGCRGSGPP